MPDPGQGVLKIAVVERYGKNRMANAFIKGLFLRKGAIASSIAHDSHNIICVGASNEEMARAVNEITDKKGGITVVADGEVTTLELPVAGLMSTDPGPAVAGLLENLENHRSLLSPQRVFEVGIRTKRPSTSIPWLWSVSLILKL